MIKRLAGEWLTMKIADHPGWNAVYDDPLAVIFVRNMN